MLLIPEQFLGFLAAAVLITLAPGPDNLMVLAVGISRGRARGIVFGLGCALGCLSHTVLAALGVSALIAASPIAFLCLKIGGGLYLIWLGVQALRSDGRIQLTKDDGENDSLWRLFAKGLFANAINPKVILFFLSFLPQFVLAKHGSVGWQTVQLGLVFMVQAAMLFAALGYFSGVVGQWLQRNARVGVWLDRLTGTLFIALGLRLMVVR